MSISGIPGSTWPASLTNTERAITERRPQAVVTEAPSGSTAMESRAAASSAAALPDTPPPGTDPVLWNVLSAEERVWFARVGAMGPLTYGRVLNGQAAPPTPDVRGGRLDLKV